MRTHNVKCWPKLFERVKTGQKTFDVRNNDRDYQAGDVLVLEEFDPHKKVKIEKEDLLNYEERKEAEDKLRYTGQKATFLIGYVMPLVQMPGMAYPVVEVLNRNASLVVMSLLPYDSSPAKHV